MIHYLPRPDGWDDAYRKAALAAGMSESAVLAALRACEACAHFRAKPGSHVLPYPGMCDKTNHYCNTERGPNSLSNSTNYCGPQGRWWTPRPCAG